MPYRTGKGARVCLAMYKPYKALNCFKMKNQKNKKTDPFFRLKKISCTSKLKNIQKNGFKGAKKKSLRQFLKKIRKTTDYFI